jgi:hypothetical protein
MVNKWLALIVLVVVVAVGMQFLNSPVPSSPVTETPDPQADFENGVQSLKNIWSAEGISFEVFNGEMLNSMIELESSQLDTIKQNLVEHKNSYKSVRGNEGIDTVKQLVDFHIAVVDYGIAFKKSEDATALVTQDVLFNPCDNLSVFRETDAAFLSYSGASVTVVESLNDFVENNPAYAKQVRLENVNPELFSLREELREQFDLTNELEELCSE